MGSSWGALGTGLSWGGSTYEQGGMGQQGLDDPSELPHMETGALWALWQAQDPTGV